MSEIAVHYRNLGDRRTGIGGTIVDSNNSPINLSGMTVTFTLTKDVDGDVIIDNQSASIVSASAGTVQYALTANDVTAIGTSEIVCWAWFKVSNGTTSDKHPVGRKYQIIFEEAE